MLDTVDMLFVDETWAGLAMSRMYGYSPPGEPAVIHRAVRGPKISVIGAMSCRGPEALGFVHGGVNGEAFLAWVRTKLARRLRAGTLVIMDQLRVHKKADIRAEIERHGARVVFLPAYSPELNPIEHIWGIVKSVIKTVGPEEIAEVKQVFGKAWGAIDRDVFWKTVRHCGYALPS